MNALLLLTLPLMTAAIGWLTNWLAIRMLFRPRRPLRLPGITLHGLLPRRQSELAAQIGATVEREILSQHLVRELIREIDIAPHLRGYAKKLIHEGLGTRLQSLPMVGGFINANTLGMLEGMVADELEKHSGPLREQFAEEAEKRLQVKQLVGERIAGFDLAQLEAVVREVAGREFRAIEWLGGLLGFTVGLAQLGFLALTGSLGPG